MHHFFLARLTLLLAHYGYVVLFPVAVAEGPAAAMIAGAFAASGEFDFLTAFGVLVLADITGDALYYVLGRYSHQRLTRGIGARLGLTEERLDQLREGFVANDWKLLLLGKTQALGAAILYFAGATRMSFGRFLAWNLVGTLPKVVIFELAGFFIGQGVIHTTRYADVLGIVSSIVALLLIAFYFMAKRFLEERIERVG